MVTHSGYQLDRLLEYARSHFLSLKLGDDGDATEKSWDAFERMKTLEPGADKKRCKRTRFSTGREWQAPKCALPSATRQRL